MLIVVLSHGLVIEVYLKSSGYRDVFKYVIQTGKLESSEQE